MVFSGVNISPDGNDLIGIYGTAASRLINSRWVAILHIPTMQITKLEYTSQFTYYFAIDQNWAVWLEEPSYDEEAWVIHAYNRLTGQSAIVAKNIIVNGKPVNYVPYISLYNDDLVWSQTAQTPQGIQKQAWLRNLKTGVNTVMSTNGTGALISWPWAAWASLQSTQESSYMVMENLQTQQQYIIHQVPSYYAIYGASIAYSGPNLHHMYYIPDVTKSDTPEIVKTADANTEVYVEFPELNQRLISWQMATNALIWDNTLQRLVQLPFVDTTDTTNSAEICGHYLIWTDAITAQVLHTAMQQRTWADSNIYIIDINTLPTSIP